MSAGAVKLVTPSTGGKGVAITLKFSAKSKVGSCHQCCIYYIGQAASNVLHGFCWELAVDIAAGSCAGDLQTDVCLIDLVLPKIAAAARMR
jgi:hypothetical protein